MFNLFANKQSGSIEKEIKCAPRRINDFHGSAVVIGCSHNHCSCNNDKNLHGSVDEFFTVDMTRKHQPDLLMDITEKLPVELKNRFKLTLLENLDFSAYSSNQYSSLRGFLTDGTPGFTNIWNMTKDDGFILIVGCPREKDFREQLYARNLKYIELDSDNANVLISKNQHLNIQAIQQQISLLPSALQDTIQQAKKMGDCHHVSTSQPTAELHFCEQSFDDIPTMEEAIHRKYGRKKF